ncbi:hypothetical protein FM076_22775 [Streptomyces albus subsp. chlorinus]|uniref:hypothetical protein n=1 Tax=Streptomyces albus TaxID=1888 RepID=UPI0015702C0E|nr:hypothetical protein [Streptomyces albus]NSC23824.1 hypothetical protein [Streptomyces albus subsp. chlorinus]
MRTVKQEEKELRGWLSGRLPEGLFTRLVEVTVDREEITVVGAVPEPAHAQDATAAERAAACEGRIAEFRERSRETRVAIARETERRYGKKVSWGAECGGSRALFTQIAAPVMTRLRQPQRQVLDTLIAAGVARSRSEALSWCVRLVERNTDAWLRDLRASLAHLEDVRAQGPDADDPAEDEA